MATSYNVDFINPFLTAVVQVLQTMANVQVTPGKPYINRKRTSACDITGLIGITGHAPGAMSLSLDEGAILQIVNNMLYESYEELNDEIADAVGELTNMIAGTARGELSKQGMSFQASTPTVIRGRGHVISHISSAPILAIPFTTEAGKLVVEVSFARCGELDSAACRGGMAEGPDEAAQAAEAPAAEPPAESSGQAVSPGAVSQDAADDIFEQAVRQAGEAEKDDKES